MRFIFGEYTPDQPAHLSEGLSVADGVYAIQNGYAPIPSFVPSSNGQLAGVALGAASYRRGSATYTFAATGTNLYRYTSSGFASVKSGLASTGTVGVRFASFGAFMLATNGIDPIQKFDPASPSSFTNLGGSPPTARFLAVVRGFVVAGYAADDPLRVAWSDNGTPTIWTPGSGEAGFFQMTTGGDQTGFVGGEDGLIFQENRIVRMSYTADDRIWDFQEIAKDVGCMAPKSIATYGRTTFFLSNKGFMTCDGATVTPIGDEKVNRTFLTLIDRSYLENMSAVIDPLKSLYIVSLPNANPTSSAFVYNYALGRWTTAPIRSELMFPALAQGVSLDDLDATYGNLDNVPFSLDSVALRGGYPLLLLFDGTHKLGALAGAPMAAQITDGQREVYQGQRARARSVRPMTDSGLVTVSIAGTNSMSAGEVETAYAMPSASGVYRVRENWNLMRVKLSIPAGAAWTYVQGYGLEAVPAGRA